MFECDRWSALRDIWVEGKLISPAFDIAVVAGGTSMATMLTVTAIVVDGSLILELKSVTYDTIQ